MLLMNISVKQVEVCLLLTVDEVNSLFLCALTKNKGGEELVIDLQEHLM